MSDQLRFDILKGETALTELFAKDIAATRRIATPPNRLKIDQALVAWNCFARPAGSNLVVLVGWDHNEIVLIWPFVVKGRSAVWLGSGHSYREIVIVDSPNTEIWVKNAWSTAKRKLGADVIRCPRVKDDNPAFAILEAERAAVVGQLESLFLKLDAFENWEDYYRSLNGNFRNDLRRRERRLAAKANPCFQLLENTADIERALSWTFEQKEIWARRKNISLNLGINMRDYYRGIVMNALSAGSLMFGVLTHDDKILASRLTVIDGPWAEVLISTYDRDWQIYSPGILLFDRMIRWAFERKITVLDFGIGSEPYKIRFAANRSVIHNYVVPCTLWGKLYVTLYLPPRRRIASLFKRLPPGAQKRLREFLSRFLR